MFQILTLILCTLFFFLGGCGEKKKEAPSSAQIVNIQYHKLLTKIWSELDPTQERILGILIQKEAEGGAGIHDLLDQQDVVDQLIGKKLAVWDTNVAKYLPTKLGSDVYKEGEKVAAEEAKKPENQRNLKLLKKNSK